MLRKTRTAPKGDDMKDDASMRPQRNAAENLDISVLSPSK